MILKNEEENIETTLKSMLGQLDGVLIEDTGSTDNTNEIIERVCREAGVPLILFYEEWQDFSHNRNILMNRALEEFGPDGWLLQIDADWVLKFSQDWKDGLSDDIHAVSMRAGNQIWALPKITKLDTKHRYQGKVHEYLSAGATNQIPGVSVNVLKYSPERHPEDLELLKGETDPRSIFYRAQTHLSLGNIDEAIQDYKLRTHLDGYVEEAFFSKHVLGDIYKNHKNNRFQALYWYFAAHKQDQRRNEPLIELSGLFRELEMYEFARIAMDKAFANEKNVRSLFVDLAAWGWKRNYEGAMAYWYDGDKERAAALWYDMRVDPDCPAEYRKNAKENIEKYC